MSVVTTRRHCWALAGASLAALGFSLAPASAAPSARNKGRAAPSLSLQGGKLGSFTPAVADPRLAAAFAQRRARAAGGAGFRFTPVAAQRADRTVRVAVRARAATPAAAQRSLGTPVVRTLALSSALPTTAITPTAYNLGASVGWKRFAVNGDVARVEGGTAPGRRDSAVVDLSYSLGRATARVAAAADRTDGPQQRLVEADRSAAVDVGGAFAITRNLAVTGGVRYKIQRDRLAPLDDERRDSQAVYVGTAFKF